VKGKILVYDTANNKYDAIEGSCETMFCELGGINPGDLSWTERKERFYSSSSSSAGGQKVKSQHRRLADKNISAE